MIRAMIFDLDGTLVQTERLKALSYARAAADLSANPLGEEEVVEAFKEVVGRSRREVAQALMVRFGLEKPSRARMGEYGVSEPWQAFVQVRLEHYNEMLSDPEVIRGARWPHNVSLLEEARASSCKVGLATMSHCQQVRRVLDILELSDAFDFVASRDDVEKGKPDPEMYILVARELDVSPEESLVIEDSPAGVRAAMAAGMSCIVVTTPFTRKAIHEQHPLIDRWVVDDPTTLLSVVREMVQEKRRGEEGTGESCLI